MDKNGYDQLISKTLITGANGYIGKHFLTKFNENQFLKISRKSSEGFIKCDLSSKNDVLNLIESFKITKIINLASFVPKNKDQYHSEENKINDLITSNIVKFFNCKLIHISTLAIYEHTNSLIIDESTNIKEIFSKYSQSKYNSENIIINNYSHPYLILRIPGIFGGDRRSGLIYNAIKNNLLGKKIKVEFILKNWSSMYIDDFLEILNQSNNIQLKDSKIINVNYEKQFSIYEILNIISKSIIKKETYSKKDKNIVKFKTNNFLKFFDYPKNTLEQSLLKYIEKLKNVK